MRKNILMIVFFSAIGILIVVAPLTLAEVRQLANGNRAKTKDEQSRQIQIETERLNMELKENLMKKKLVELENLKAMMMEKIISSLSLKSIQRRRITKLPSPNTNKLN